MKGGAESYMFELSKSLEDSGHEIKYWGMSDERNLVEDEYGVFAENIDYHNLSGFNKIKRSSKLSEKKVKYSYIYYFNNCIF